LASENGWNGVGVWRNELKQIELHPHSAWQIWRRAARMEKAERAKLMLFSDAFIDMVR